LVIDVAGDLDLISVGVGDVAAERSLDISRVAEFDDAAPDGAWRDDACSKERSPPPR
jgi:hypothetical protein